MRAFLLLVSRLANYETVIDLGEKAFTAGLVSMSALCRIDTVISMRRSRLIRGYWLQGRYLIYYRYPGVVGWPYVDRSEAEGNSRSKKLEPS